MKTIAELFEIIAQAVSENSREYRTWFVEYSGHVNTLRVDFYITGWESDKPHAKLEVKLDEDGIQAAYWFIKTKLKRD